MQQSFYNRGNALFRQGESELGLDPDATIERWQEAVKEYDSALRMNNADKMAAHNKAFVEEKLMALKKERSKSGQNKDPGSKQEQQNEGGQGQQQQGQGNQRQDQGSPGSQSDKADPGQQGNREGEEQQAGGNQQQQQQQQGGPGDLEDQQPGDPNEQMGAYGQMTAEQARQLLEGQRGEERALLFLPQNRTNRIRDPRKNW
jgi:Ca-activated chloride channel homolog